MVRPLISFLFACQAIGLLIIGFFLIAAPHTFITDYFIQLFGLEHKSLVIKNRVSSLQILISGIGLSVAGILLLLPYFRKKCVQSIQDLLFMTQSHLKKIHLFFLSLSKRHKTVLYSAGGLFVLVQGYYAATIHVQIDEAFTFVHIVSRGPLFSLMYYPGPNNHIFYSFCASLAHTLISSPEWAMRIVSMAASWGFLTLLFTYITRRKGFWIALAVITATGLSPHFLYYSVQGRGYMLQAFLLLLQFALMPAAIGKVRGAALSTVIISAMAFFVLPTHVFFHLSILLISLTLYHQSKESILRIFFISGAGTMVAAVFYLPALLVNGLAPFTQNSWVQSTHHHFALRMVSAFAEYSAWIWTDLWWETLLTLIVLFISLLSFIRQPTKTKEPLYLMPAAIFISFLLICSVTHKLPYNRIWLPAIPFFISTATMYLSSKLPIKAVMMIAVPAALFFMVRMHRTYVPMAEGMYGSLSNIEKTVKNHPGGTLYASDDFYHTCLLFHAMKTGNQYSVVSAENNPDLLVLTKQEPTPSGAFLLLYEDDFARMYGRATKPHGK